MFKEYQSPVVGSLEHMVFEELVRRDHWIRRAEEHVDFLQLRETVEEFYTHDFGCPGVEPVLLIKLELILFHDNLSDSQLWQRVETDMAYRWFLGLASGGVRLNEFDGHVGRNGARSI